METRRQLFQIVLQLLLRIPLPTEHDACALLHVGNVFQRIAIDEDQICASPYLYRAELVPRVHELCRTGCSGTDCLERREARVYKIAKLLVKAEASYDK